jgi:hypothetical protein
MSASVATNAKAEQVRQAALLHGAVIEPGSAAWPEVSTLQRAGLIRVAEWLDGRRAKLRFVEPTPPEGWSRMSEAPRNASWVVVRNTAGEHVAHWACDLSGEEQPPFKGWFRAVRDANGKVLMYAEIAGGEPEFWRPLREGEAA